MRGEYRDLKVWQAALNLVYLVYEITQRFPSHERYGLVSQMRRASVSVPSNIAEGKGRSTSKELALFLCHSRGSLLELETQCMIAEHLGYISKAQTVRLNDISSEVGRMLNGLIHYAEHQTRRRIEPVA